MKKNVKTIMGGFLSVALLAGFISCSNGTSDETNQAAQGLNLSGASSASGTAIAENIYSGDLITFKATAASVDSENVNLIIKYDRSAAGAKEQISLNDVELEVKHNGTAISMPSTIKFELDEYGALFDNKKDSEHYKEYKGKLSINKKIVSGDTVTVQLNKAKVSGEGAASVKLDNVLISLIDTAPTAGKTGYYNELCPNNEEYKPLITKKNGKGLNEVETPAPAVNTNENNNTNTNTNTDNTNTNTNTDNNNTNTNNNNATPAPAAGTTTETNLLIESFTLSGWNNVCIPGNKFTSEKKTIDITYSKNTSNDGNVMQLIIVQGWVKLNTARVSGNVAKDANNEDLNPWAVSEDGTISEWTFSVNLTDEEWTKVKAEGFAVQGTGATITKVVLK